MFILPIIGFVVAIIINKRKAYFVSTKMKRFILFDLSYGWLIFTGMLVAYGLSITTALTKL